MLVFQMYRSEYKSPHFHAGGGAWYTGYVNVFDNNGKLVKNFSDNCTKELDLSID